MANIFLKGEHILLRPLQKSDLNEDYLGWLNDAQVCEFNSHAIFPYTFEKMETFFNTLYSGDQKNVVLAIIDIYSEKHIGNISLQNINWVSRNAEYAILLGNKDFWNKGISYEASKLIINYGFERLNLHRIYCGTSIKNLGMQKLANKLKMKQEGIRREAFYKNGEFVDIIEFGILKTDF